VKYEMIRLTEAQRRTGVNGFEPDADWHQLGWYRRTFGPFVGIGGFSAYRQNTDLCKTIACINFMHNSCDLCMDCALAMVFCKYLCATEMRPMLAWKPLLNMPMFLLGLIVVYCTAVREKTIARTQLID